MAKARVILADTDLDYIAPLQQKLIEECFERIELEVITDRGYYEALFSSPQKAELLIVSQELYDPSIHKHSIGNVFVLTEQDEDFREGSGESRIFKYTSVNEIFNTVVGQCPALNLDGEDKKEPQIVLVYSACGGAGKTTVAMGLCAGLARNYKRVLYIGADRLQNFQRVLKNKTPVSDSDAYAKLAKPDASLYENIKFVIRREGFYYLPPFMAALMSLNLKYSVFQAVAVGAKKSGEYDFVVIDADAAFDEDKAALLNIADKVIIVTKQTASSVYATNMLVSNINGVGGDKYIFICNDFD